MSLPFQHLCSLVQVFGGHVFFDPMLITMIINYLSPVTILRRPYWHPTLLDVLDWTGTISWIPIDDTMSEYVIVIHGYAFPSRFYILDEVVATHGSTHDSRTIFPAL